MDNPIQTINKIIIETAANAVIAAKKIDFIKSFPNTGEIVSSFTISNL